MDHWFRLKRSPSLCQNFFNATLNCRSILELFVIACKCDTVLPRSVKELVSTLNSFCHQQALDYPCSEDILHLANYDFTQTYSLLLLEYIMFFVFILRTKL